MERVRQYPQIVRPGRITSDSEIKQQEPGERKHKTILREHLVNKLNFINFQDGIVFVNFKHPKYDRILTLPAKPQPCVKDTLECYWASPDGTCKKVKAYQFQNLYVPDGPKLLCVASDSISITDKGIQLHLPESCLEFRARKRLRNFCRNIHAQLIQNSVFFTGYLIDFTAQSFRVEVTVKPPQTFQWIYPNSRITTILSNSNEVIFAGDCRIIRQTLGQKTRTFVLEPLNQMTHRFSPKEYRSSRYQLVPSPKLVFEHPLTHKVVRLNVLDLSGSGLSVEEDEGIPVLMPGMMIPEMELSFARSYKIKCRGQVINRNAYPDQRFATRASCGVAFLDMDPEDHSRLLALLNQAKDKNAYISDVIDPDALWNFFFETGFIYPKKYAFVQSNKEEVKAIYEKLYTQCPSIARHFVYQDNGRILGHMSMLRYIGNSWMIQHHAANTVAHNQAGVAVLNQIIHYTNDTYKISSAHLDLIFCYFRPENKFPMKVFGGASRHLKAPKGCSLDYFAYFHRQKIFNNELDMPEHWELIQTCSEDLMELETFYEHLSGGLMLNALGLEPDMLDYDDVSREYQRLGLKRKRYLFSLKKDGKLKAIALVNISDVGLNLSDLTNCINFIVLDSEDLSKDILYSSLSMLSTKYEQSEMPVLLYPLSYADSEAIEYEKQYILWAFNLQYLDPCLKFLNRLLRKV